MVGNSLDANLEIANRLEDFCLSIHRLKTASADRLSLLEAKAELRNEGSPGLADTSKS